MIFYSVYSVPPEIGNNLNNYNQHQLLEIHYLSLFLVSHTLCINIGGTRLQEAVQHLFNVCHFLFLHDIRI